MSESGWNRSSSTDVRKTERQPFGACRIVSAIVVVAVLATVAVWYSKDSSKDTTKAEKPTAPKALEQVKPAAAPRPEPETANPLKETYRDARGILRYKIGNGRAPDPTRPTKKPVSPFRDANGKKRLPSLAIFKSTPENEIALLVGVPPGTTLFGTRTYNEKFERDFLKSLETKIVVEPEDSPRIAALKRAVQEAKEEVKSRMDKGEKLKDILGEARKELVRLAQYKNDLKRQVAQIVNEGKDLSEADIGDCVKAANEMLKAKGISPISPSVFVRGNLKVQGAVQKAARSGQAD